MDFTVTQTEEMQMQDVDLFPAEAQGNDDRSSESRAEPWAGSRLPNNNKKHLCVIDQAVRGR